MLMYNFFLSINDKSIDGIKTHDIFKSFWK